MQSAVHDSSAASGGYLHGYSDEERSRLGEQARVLAPWIHRGLPYAHSRNLLEIGCGTGAQLERLLDAFPQLHVTGVDRAADQIDAARRVLSGPSHAPRAALVAAPAEALPFGDAAFDSAFLCWILEHVESPARVLAELHRVLAPGAPVVITEVQNASLLLRPHAPRAMRYWDALNAQQLAMGGDPYVGARLGHYLHHAGFQDIVTTPGDMLFDDRDPAGRAAFCAYTKTLFLSAAPALLAAGRVDQGDIDGMCEDLDAIGRGPGSLYFYTFVRARCRR
jgi:ubiquinone/menaquinone biosynthesis C-methylase UbiE